MVFLLKKRVSSFQKKILKDNQNDKHILLAETNDWSIKRTSSFRVFDYNCNILTESFKIVCFWPLSLKYQIPAIWLVKTTCIFLIFFFFCQWNVEHPKSRREKNNSFRKQKISKNSKKSKTSNGITYNIYDIYNSYKQMHLQFSFAIYIKIMAGFHSTKTNEEYKEIKKCKYYKSTYSMDASVLSVGQKRDDHLKNIEVLTPDTLNSTLQHFFAEINN